MKSMIMSNRTSARRLRLESLEERTLLAVTAGLAEPAAALAAPTGAANWVVNTTDDPSSWDETDAVVSLREAIGRAQAGDSITFDESLADSTITLSGSQLEITKSITIDANSIGGITIDANSQSRVLSVSGGTADVPVELIGLTVTGGYNTGGDGGGIYNTGSLVLNNCLVSRNTAHSESYDPFWYGYGTGYGGGIFSTGNLTLVDTVVSSNEAYGDSGAEGGGVYNTSGTITLIRSSIINNDAHGGAHGGPSRGGGICNISGSITLSDSTISDNRAYQAYDGNASGGGIFNSSGSVSMTNCTVSNNWAYGGDDYYSDGYGSFGYGGGVYSGGTLTMTNCAVCGNGAYGGDGHDTYGDGEGSGGNGLGGGIYGSSILINCTIANNRADGGSGPNYGKGEGGGIYGDNSQFYNTIIAANYADTGKDVSGSGNDAYNTLSSYTGWSSSSKCPFYDSTQPLFTDAANGDYSLAAGSLAINHGSNDYISGYETDLAGNPRIFDGTVDIGAYEYQEESNFETPSTVVTTSLDVVNPADGLISLREAISYAESGDTVTFNTLLAGQTITLDGNELFIGMSVSIDASSIGGMTIDADGKSRVFNVSGGTTDAPVELTGLTITGGYANVSDSNDGGAVYNAGTLTLTNCAVTGNSSGGYGGAFYNNSSSAILTLRNCTVAGNSAALSGGGIFVYYGTVNLYNTIIAQNTASYSGSDIYRYSGSLYGYNTLSSYTGWASGSSNCLSYNSSKPLFAFAAVGNYTLAKNSQAVDKGDNSYISGYETDLTGNSRIANGTVDLGAYELDESLFEPVSTVVTTNLDIVDLTDGLISLREAISYAAAGDTVTFDPNLAGKTIILAGAELSVDKGIKIDASSIGGMTVDAGGKSRVFYVSGGTSSTPVELTGLTVTGGSVSGSNDGGAVYNSGTLTLTNCTVSGNTASYNGGGIYNTGRLKLTGCTFTGNRSDDDGGAVYNSGTLTLTNCTVSGNSSGDSGGGIYNNSTLTLTNCTVAGNSSDYRGGGIYNYGTSYLYNTIIAQNTASGSGDDVYRSSGSLSAYNTLSSFAGWTNSSDCLFCGSSTPLFTDAAGGDYSLVEGSLAINHGNNSYISGYETDLAGNPRVFDGTVDIGAYEYQEEGGEAVLETPSTAVTTSLDIVDPTDNLISLREAILYYAAAGDTITFDPNLAGETITLSGTELSIDKGMTIDASAIGGMTIDANSRSRVFYISGGTADIPVELIGLTVAGGQAPKSHEYSSTYNEGGGIWTSGTLKLTGCTVTGNSAYAYGSESDQSYEVIGRGGGICTSGTLILTGCTVSGNSATGYGEQYKVDYGGGYVEFYGGYGYGSGGGIYVLSGTLTLTNCTVAGNTASGGGDRGGDCTGGGICNDEYSYNATLTLTNCTISGNTANNGGGIYNDFATLTMTNCTVAGNNAGNGGGAYISSGTANFYNTVIAQNTASSSGNDVYCSSGSLYAYNSLSSYTDWTVGSSGCLTYDSTFPLFADAAGGDYSLAAGSLAINHGNNSFISGYEIDLAGNPRIVDGTVDIGACEYQEEGGGVDFETPSTAVTTELDIVDPIDNLISLREALSYAESGEVVTFDASLAGQTITLGGKELVIDKAVSIDASSIGGVTISADGKSCVFNVFSASSGTSNMLVELIGLTITGGSGGGIRNSGDLTLINCSVTGNRSNGDGGGIYNSSGRLTLRNSTVAGNSGSRGGGIYYTSSKAAYFYNSIIAQNTASSSGNDVYIGSGRVSAYNSLSSYIDWASGSSNCLIYDSTLPLFADAANGDYSLAVGSLAINHGKNSYISGHGTDLAGNPRIFDGTVDIGAYEYQEEGGGTDVETPSTVVTTNLDVVEITDGLISLREAIKYAASGDTVTFDSSLAGSTITLSGSQLEITKSITIDANSIGGMTVDANSQSRVLSVSGGTSSAPVELIGLTITGGSVSDSDYGAGIYNTGKLTMTDCTVAGNSAGTSGGGISNDDGILTMTNCTVNGNSAKYDGGISNDDGTLTMTNCTVVGNSAGDCGGIDNYYGTVTMVNCAVTLNTATGMFGAIYNAGGKVTMTNCAVTMNTAKVEAGIWSDSEMRLYNCTVAGNNSTSGSRCGIVVFGRTYLYNTIVAQNTANGSESDVTCGSNVSLYAYNTLSSFTRWASGSSNNLTYNSSQPLFTDAAGGDYTLAENSQAIDQGKNNYISGYDTDLAGNPRLVGGTVDIGAYEYDPNASQTEQLAAPVISTGSRGVYVSHGANRHQIQWSAVANASGYELAYSADGNSWTTISAAGTGAVVTGLTYGADVTYRVRALGTGSYTDSDWSAVKVFNVCPMDINGDGDIAGSDRTIMATSWLAEEGDDEYRYYADINGDGEVSNTDRPFIGQNWNKEAGDDDLVYPRPVRAADTVFAAYESADIDVDLNIF